MILAWVSLTKMLAEFFREQNRVKIWLQINTIEGKTLVECIYRPPDKADGPSGLQFWDNTLGSGYR